MMPCLLVYPNVHNFGIGTNLKHLIFNYQFNQGAIFCKALPAALDR